MLPTHNQPRPDDDGEPDHVYYVAAHTTDYWHFWVWDDASVEEVMADIAGHSTVHGGTIPPRIIEDVLDAVENW